MHDHCYSEARARRGRRGGQVHTSRAAAERRSAHVAAQLEQERQASERAKQATAADLAACREQLSESRREAACARDVERAVEARAANLAAELEASRAALVAAQTALSAESEVRLDEARTHALLERVLRDKRMHGRLTAAREQAPCQQLSRLMQNEGHRKVARSAQRIAMQELERTALVRL